MATNADDKAKTKAPRLGFNEKGEAYPGVDPVSGERLTVTLGALKSEFGPSKGETMYRQIALVAGGGKAPLPMRLEEGARDIGLAGADRAVVEQVNAILAAKE